MFSKHQTWLTFLFLICAVAMPSRLQGQSKLADESQLEITGETMGPIKYKVIVGHYPETVEPEELQAAVKSALERVNGLMSTYIPDSDVSRFNNSDSTDFIKVDAETAAVVKRALEISKQTEGAFDITVGPAVNLWKFGPDRDELAVLPTAQDIELVQESVGYKNLEVRADPPAIRKQNAAVEIDLSAIAKGYAVDQVAIALDEAGCEHFMAEVGGEVVARGERTGGGKWRIGIERPNSVKSVYDIDFTASKKLSGVAAISNQALATSGDYQNFFEFEGRRYSHTIDPKTCKPVTHGLASACVIAEDCMTADALATAIMVLGVERGKSVCEKLGVEYCMIERDSDFGTELTEVTSKKFPLGGPPKAQALQNKSADVESGAGQNRADTAVAKKAETSIWPAFLGAIVIFGLAIIGMAVGSIFANKPVQGSCGGLSTVTDENGDSTCGVCSKPTTDCVEQTAENQAEPKVNA